MTDPTKIAMHIDGEPLEVLPGSTILQAAHGAGISIPHFCYHKKLSIAASCRMCLVEVEKVPKPVPACATTVASGMIVRTRSESALRAQQAVMEFLLINHPLDCPICDQGGECQLQDLALGYGGSHSRYTEEKRVAPGQEDVGPLISMKEMSRCIHCTRCVRFGQEIAGVMELGMAHRGEHSAIETFVSRAIESELSGNLVDICPVGALTSRPFRYRGRAWELSRRKSVSPHDSTGTNLILGVKNDRVIRATPLENEAVNECWLADRDRFSIDALYSKDRLSSPMVKVEGAWKEVSWEDALGVVVHGWKSILAKQGASAIGALVSPHSTLEEQHLCVQLLRGLGSPHIDHRLRHAEFVHAERVRYLGMPIADLSNLESVFVVGSSLRKDHPLFAQRIRQAARKSCTVSALVETIEDWALPVSHWIEAPATHWTCALAEVVIAVAAIQGLPAPVPGTASPSAMSIAQSLVGRQRTALLLGNAAAHHPKASALLAMANWIGRHTGVRVGYLTEAANTVGAQWVGAVPGDGGRNAAQMLEGGLASLLLLDNEPVFDSAAGGEVLTRLANSEMVVTLSPFRANLEFSKVLLPIATFAETSGTFINAEGRVQTFRAAVRPQGAARPAWKVLRVLANMMELPGFDADSSEDVLRAIPGLQNEGPWRMDGWSTDAARLGNDIAAVLDPTPCTGHPVVADMYGLDGIVRRSPSLQATADALRSNTHVTA